MIALDDALRGIEYGVAVMAGIAVLIWTVGWGAEVWYRLDGRAAGLKAKISVLETLMSRMSKRLGMRAEVLRDKHAVVRDLKHLVIDAEGKLRRLRAAPIRIVRMVGSDRDGSRRFVAVIQNRGFQLAPQSYQGRRWRVSEWSQPNECAIWAVSREDAHRRLEGIFQAFDGFTIQSVVEELEPNELEKRDERTGNDRGSDVSGDPEPGRAAA